jgi:hypothetical protein
MAETGAQRQRRYRLHKRGDHTLCVVGRCPEVTPPVTRHTGSDQREQTGGLDAPGRALWSEVTEGQKLPPLQTALLLQICRTVDRLDKLDAQLRGDEDSWLTVERDPDDPEAPVQVIVDKALAEERLQATALKTLIGEFRQALRAPRPGRAGASGNPAPSESPAPSAAGAAAAAAGGAVVISAAARIAQRRNAPTG